MLNRVTARLGAIFFRPQSSIVYVIIFYLVDALLIFPILCRYVLNYYYCHYYDEYLPHEDEYNQHIIPLILTPY